VETSRAGRRFIRAGLGALAAGSVLLVAAAVAAPAGASVGDPTPTPYSLAVEGNLDCGDIGYAIEFKINEQPTNQLYTDGTYSVTISNLESPGGRMEFDWSSPQFWDALLVKQADGGLRYDYDPARTSDQDVQTVEGQNSGGISHLTFCSDGVDPTTTTTTEGTTTTTEGTTTTTEGTTTTTEGTTTTTEGTTTTQATVLGVVVTPTTAKPAVQVLGTQTLPRTGTNTGWLTGLGAGLVLAGASVLLVGGRKARLARI
jgi:LPXTG-motif cell wall-anchored protein